MEGEEKMGEEKGRGGEGGGGGRVASWLLGDGGPWDPVKRGSTGRPLL